MTDPRIIALAKDPRTGPQWDRIVRHQRVGGTVEKFMPFARAVTEHGLEHETFKWLAIALLIYVRTVATDVAEDDQEVELALAILRDDQPEAGDPWSASQACGMTDALVDAGLLTPDEEPSPLELTTLGRAVMLVLGARIES
jgi:hypothetical protein